MTPERWQHIKRLYHAALELAEPERGLFLAQVCGADEELRREVESLLAAHDRAGSFIAGNAVEDHAKRIASPSDQALSEEQATAMLPNPLTKSSPRTINQYRIISLLGKGGMGEVWLAEDTRLKRKVALKLLPAEFTNDAERLRRFEQEALAISALNHPNIITIHEIGESEAGRFIVMELVAGRTLRTMAAESITLDSLIAWGSQLAKALHVAHAAGITHRDIKPENIMVREDGYVKVLDFGLARLAANREDMAQAESLSGTQPGMLLGTVKYMSPEQARGEKVTSATDIFALGILFYELATGAHPFSSATLLGTLQQITTGTPVAPVQLNPELPAALNALILRMLAKQAGARPSAVEIDQALSGLSGQRGSGQLQRPAKPAIERHTVGREKERAELRSGFASVLNGRGQLLCVAGEPGIGKTTLVEDFLAELAAEGQCTIARGRCSERLAGTEAYLPLLEALDTLLNAASVRSPAFRRNPGAAPLPPEGGTTNAETMRQIAPTWYAQVVPLSGDSEESARLLAEVKAASQERMKRELANFLQAVAQSQPLVLFFDDLHWADVSTIDLLNFLAGKFDTLKVLIVVTYRPSDMLLSKHPFLQIKPDLQARGVCRELLLEFLNEAEIAEYLALEFSGHRFPAEFPQLIHAKTEGSPLFMADLVRYLRDRSVIANTSGEWTLAQALPDIERELPESVRGMIERKIAQLSEDDRKLLTCASVQGYEFDSAVVAQALNLDADEIEERLEKLERVFAFVKLTSEAEFPNHELTFKYRFIHVLYQNLLYAGLRTRQKVSFSRDIAHALESFHGKQAQQVANELATLYETAREFAHASDYFLLAAEHSSQVFAVQEAVDLARRGIAMVEKLPDDAESQAKELPLQITLANALVATQGYGASEVEQIFLRARVLCQQLSDIESELPVLFGLAALFVVRAQYEKAKHILEEFQNLAERQNNPAQIYAHQQLGYILYYQGDLTNAHLQAKRSISMYNPDIHRPLTWLYGDEPGMGGHSEYAWILWALGYADQALSETKRSLQIGQEVSQANSQAASLALAGFHYQFRRDAQEALKYAEAAMAMSSEHGLPYWLAAGRFLRGCAMVAMDQVVEGVGEIREGITDFQATGSEIGLAYCHYYLIEAYAKAGLIDEGLKKLEEAQAVVEEKGERLAEPGLLRLNGDLLLRTDKANREVEAERCYQKSISIAQKQNAKSMELLAATSLARLWQQQGKLAEARQMLAEIYGWFTEGFDTADLKDAKALLEELTPPANENA